MKKAIVVNSLLNGDSWAREFGGTDPISVILEKAVSLAKDDVFVVTDHTAENLIKEKINGLKRISVQNRKANHVFDRMYNALQNYRYIIYIFFDTPLFDVEITKKMEELHRQEIAEYTYGEGFPIGFTPEILRVVLLPRLAALLKKEKGHIQRDSVFSAISKEINSFDIETYFSHKNMRLKRLELTTSKKRNKMLVQRIVEQAGAWCSFEKFCTIVEDSPAVVRTLPSFAEIEITGKTNGRCVYSPANLREIQPGDMKVGEYTDALDKILDFAGGLHVSISYLGEPLLHPAFREIIERSLDRGDVDLIVETDGLQCAPKVSDFLAGLESERLSVIFQVDAVKEETYRTVRDGDFGRAQRNIRYLLSKKRENVYVQFVRMDSNENEMMNFFDVWEAEGAKVIIQKYNSYLEILPALSSSDLTPLERMPCWHLQRDIVVFSNGDIPRCMQDINGKILLGNIFKADITDIWKRGETHYIDHCRRKYDTWCDVCDEYYTFNF